MRSTDRLSIGELSLRTGISVSAIRFYEAKGLIEPMRSAGNQRLFFRSDIRRLSFILIAQHIGLKINKIREELSGLPSGRTPSQSDWKKIGAKLRQNLDDQIAQLQQTRQNLDGCIGCGCLSLKKCALYNPGDKAARFGSGPRYTMGDQP
ncbi:redox-sensitive transcriptional activator SoxR [Sphingorhabdus arenilitoris]|uniref:Redox-sensitive transcriptional activator SoxR n=1 Tax=Sphingorhabdus arenilitoris TaxID=1490041 RepID=A0ABV8RK63_9SPHN